MKFLTAKQLGITPEVRAALIKVAKLLPGFEHLRDGLLHDGRSQYQKGSLKFDMARAVQAYDCGTACCIGGLTALVMTNTVKKPSASVKLTSQDVKRIRDFVGGAHDGELLCELFYPRSPAWDRITPDIAAQGVINFLTTGKPQWNLLLNV
jgi:hypothetical protein